MQIIYRRATPADNLTTFTIFRKALQDYSARSGVMAITGGNDPAKLGQLWESRRLFWEHLTETSDQFWLAENEAGEAIGYARSIRRDAHRELTEFFVLPGNQSAGVGKELIERAFPHDTPHRCIVATTDSRAMSRYFKAGVYPFVTELLFERVPEHVEVETDITFEATGYSHAILQTLAEIDLAILGFRRDVDHAFLMQDRQLYLYSRRGSIVGYGYFRKDLYGPFALLQDRDFPAILAHAESQGHALGANSVGFETPTINTIAVDYLVKRGYRLEGFMGSIMSNKPFGKFDNYLLTSPPYII